MKFTTTLAAILLMLTTGNAFSQDVKISYDNNQNVVAHVALGNRYDEPEKTSSDSAFIMYIEGQPQTGNGNLMLVAAYDADLSSTGSGSYLYCIVKSESPLYNTVLDFLIHANGASAFTASASGNFSECLSFNGGADSTRKTEINKAWQPFWLYDFTPDQNGQLVQRFQGSFTPYVLSNGILVRGVEIQRLSGQTTPNSHRSMPIEIKAFDDSIVGAGPKFTSRFVCTVAPNNPIYPVYNKLANAPSRHLVFNVQRTADNESCKSLSVELNTQYFN